MEKRISEGRFGLLNLVIPAEVFFHPNLTLTEKILFGFILNLSGSKQGCWAGNRWLGKVLKVGPQTISRGVSNLETEGFIKRKYQRKSNHTVEQERRIYIDPSYQERYRYLVEAAHEDSFFAIFENGY